MIQGKYSLHNTPAQEIACPCEYSEVLHKQVGTQVVSLKLVCCCFRCLFQFSGPLYLQFLVSWCHIFGEMSKNNLEISCFCYQKTEIVFREDQKAEVVSLSGN